MIEGDFSGVAARTRNMSRRCAAFLRELHEEIEKTGYIISITRILQCCSMSAGRSPL